jgi:RNA polymerase sigma-70 factor (ECF subfamily)
MVEWASILAAHGLRVWRTVYRLLDHADDALDCYQQTFLAALQIPEPEQIDDWASFLVTLATRRAMDCLCQRYRRRARFVPIDAAPELSGEADDPLQQAQASELMNRVRSGMAELPEKQAEVFWLSCLEGFPNHQIAARMQIPPCEVRVLLHRARHRLGALLNLNRVHAREDE